MNGVNADDEINALEEQIHRLNSNRGAVNASAAISDSEVKQAEDTSDDIILP